MDQQNSHIYAVIMAGGRGERFWPAGRVTRPKQLLQLYSGNTMLEESVLRLFPLIRAENILVVTNCAYAETTRQLLPIPAENIIAEPVPRDTAPCIALSVAHILRRDPEAVIITLPADHAIRPVKLFHETLQNAIEAAGSGALVTVGITPSYPATGYGYMELDEKFSPGCRRVRSFKEKPDTIMAQRFFADGNYRWNSGIFIWQLAAIRSAFHKFAPGIAGFMEKWAAGEDHVENFGECEKISIDYAIMEKAENVLAVEALFQWNDLGSWRALRSVLPLDENNNAVSGRVVTVDSANNVLVCDDGHLLGVIGMSDIAVVKSGNGILVCPLSEEQQVKELVKQLAIEHRDFI